MIVWKEPYRRQIKNLNKTQVTKPQEEDKHVFLYFYWLL